MLGYNFTQRVRLILATAREEAILLRHEYVGTEHILLGLIREEEGVASSVLQNLSIDVGAIRQKIHDTVLQGRSAVTGPDLPYTSRAKKVIELAMAEARNLKHEFIGAEHLLLGLLAEEKGIAAQVLADAGLTLYGARAEVHRLLGSPAVPSRPTAQVVTVTVEIHHTDRSIIRKDLPSVGDAIAFLRRVG